MSLKNRAAHDARCEAVNNGAEETDLLAGRNQYSLQKITRRSATRDFQVVRRRTAA
jgi:hypothetical protein